MAEKETVEILIGDDTMLDEVVLERDQATSLLSDRLAPIRHDLHRPEAELRVEIIDDTNALRDTVFSKRWDFIALDNNWDEAGPGLGQFGFDLALELRSQDGPNQDTPLCIFTRHNWLESPQNISKVYSLDDSIGSVGSFADFFPKPIRDQACDQNGDKWLERFGVELLVRMKACFILRELRRSNEHLHTALVAEHGLVGRSREFRDLTELCCKIGPSNASVLLIGETGTGKEVFARYIHRLHPQRCDKPFVAVNCAALSEQLLESELFGHEKGAFTGAVSKKKGLFEIADCGSLFIDEVGDMPKSIQVKLLRVLNDGSFRPVGSTDELKTNARIIAATNRILADEVAAKRFREDLYYRLEGVTMTVPPLRGRREDICLLADFFLQQFRSDYATPAVAFGNDALHVLTEWKWPGNIRELKNVVERAVILAQEASISVDDLRLGPSSPLPLESRIQGRLPGESVQTYVDRLYADEIRAALKRSDKSLSKAAGDLGLKANTLFNRIRKYGEDNVGYR